jgi:hypothetical protein
MKGTETQNHHPPQRQHHSCRNADKSQISDKDRNSHHQTHIPSQSREDPTIHESSTGLPEILDCADEHPSKRFHHRTRSVNPPTSVCVGAYEAAFEPLLPLDKIFDFHPCYKRHTSITHKAYSGPGTSTWFIY